MMVERIAKARPDFGMPQAGFRAEEAIAVAYCRNGFCPARLRRSVGIDGTAKPFSFYLRIRFARRNYFQEISPNACA